MKKAKNWINKTLSKVKENKLSVIKNTTPKKPETIYVPGLTLIPKMTLELKPNYDALMKLLEMRTYSKGSLQDIFISRLEEHFASKGAITKKDSYGSLYVTKGNAKFYPCVVGHTDINQAKRDNVSVIKNDTWIFGFDNDKAEQCGIGADDKVGVYFAVHMFDLFDNIKLFFPKDEEVGLIGTYAAEKEFFSDCSMLVQLDRNSYKNDLITYTNGITVCSDEFVEAAKPIMDKYMYTKGNGSCTDIGGLKKYDTVNCVAMNVSCGYINEHSSEEVISVAHFENAINFGYELLKMGVDKVWEHTAKQESYTYSSNYYSRYDDYYTYGTDLFDDISAQDSLKHNPNAYLVHTPAGSMYLHNKYKENDEYLAEIYPELVDFDFRTAQLTSITEDDNGLVENEGQQYIDDCLRDQLCPCCYGQVEISNRLLLYVDCHYCNSSFNIPSDIFETDSNKEDEVFNKYD